MSKLTTVVKKNDGYSIRSSIALKNILEQKIKSLYVGALRCIEIKFGNNFDGFEQIRREILRTGNDAIRDLNKTIDSSFNVEQIPDVVTFMQLSSNKGEVK